MWHTMWPVTWPTEANENTRVARGTLSAITVGSSNLCTGPKFRAAAPNIVADQNFSVVLDLVMGLFSLWMAKCFDHYFFCVCVCDCELIEWTVICRDLYQHRWCQHWPRNTANFCSQALRRLLIPGSEPEPAKVHPPIGVQSPSRLLADPVCLSNRHWDFYLW